MNASPTRRGRIAAALARLGVPALACAGLLLPSPASATDFYHLIPIPAYEVEGVATDQCPAVDFGSPDFGGLLWAETLDASKLRWDYDDVCADQAYDGSPLSGDNSDCNAGRGGHYCFYDDTTRRTLLGNLNGADYVSNGALDSSISILVAGAESLVAMAQDSTFIDGPKRCPARDTAMEYISGSDVPGKECTWILTHETYEAITSSGETVIVTKLKRIKPSLLNDRNCGPGGKFCIRACGYYVSCPWI